MMAARRNRDGMPKAATSARSVMYWPGWALAGSRICTVERVARS